MWVPTTAEEKVIWLTEVSNELRMTPRMELRVKRGDDDPKVSKRRSGTGQSGSYACILDLPYAGTRTPRPTNPTFRSRTPGRVPSWTSGQVRGSEGKILGCTTTTYDCITYTLSIAILYVPGRLTMPPTCS